MRRVRRLAVFSAALAIAVPMLPAVGQATICPATTCIDGSGCCPTGGTGSSSNPTTTLSGTALDASGAPLAGAQVEAIPLLENTSTAGVTVPILGSTTSAADGSYSVPVTLDSATTSDATANTGVANILIDVEGPGGTLAGAVGVPLRLTADTAAPSGYDVSVDGVNMDSDSFNGTAVSAPSIQVATAAAATGDDPSDFTPYASDSTTTCPSTTTDGTQLDATNNPESTCTYDPHVYPTTPCPKYFDGQKYYTTWRFVEKGQPLGELHLGTDTTARFTYEGGGHTSFGVGVRPEGAHWSVGWEGGMEADHSSGNYKDISAGWKGDINGDFNAEDGRIYWCTFDYSTGKEIMYWYKDTRHVLKHGAWKLNLYTGDVKTGNDTQAAYDAAPAWHQNDFYGIQNPYYKRNSGYHYGWETNYAGVSLTDKTSWYDSSYVEYHTLTGGVHHYMWGNDATPVAASITYSNGGK